MRHHIHHNLIIRASFNGDSMNLYCIDHDDGSSMYNDTDNVLVYGGIKFREGLSKLASGNLIAYADGPFPGGQRLPKGEPFADQCQGTDNAYHGNTVASATGLFYGYCAKYNTSTVD